MSKAIILAAASPILLLTFSGAPAPLAREAHAFASNSCSCLISHHNLWLPPATGLLSPSLTPAGNPKTRVQCESACRVAAKPHVQSQAVATEACSVKAANGTLVRAFYRWTESPATSPLSNKYVPAEAIGTLVRSPATTVQEWRCPADWMNNSNQLGGVTTDKGCKKFAGTITLATPPPNGTKVGDWGFTWNDGLYAFNVPANGGAAILHTVKTPAQCHFS